MMTHIKKEEATFELLTLTCEIDKWGDKRYRNNGGELHRIHGPAVIWDEDSEEWYKNGKRHRADGPAVVEPNGYKEYWIDGVCLTKKEFIQWQKDNGIKPIE